MKIRTINSEVLFADEPVRLFSAADVARLGREALASSTGKRRICLHRSPDAPLHEMLVALCRDVAYPPHRCRSTEETHFVLSGKAALLLYNENGSLESRIELGDADSGRPGYSRIPAGVFHCLEIESDVCVFLETKLGPFSPDDNEIAPFYKEQNS